MSNESIIPIGCVSTLDSSKAGFFDTTHVPNLSINNIEDCINYAKETPSNCGGKCEYVVYKNADLWDELRAANKASIDYIKSESASGSRDDYYRQQAIQHFKNAYLSISERERLDFNDNFYGYKPKWFTADDMNYFTNSDNLKRNIVSSKLNSCWVGGKNVLKKSFINSMNFDNPKDKIRCKNNLGVYVVPGDGDGLADAYLSFFQKKTQNISKKYEETEKELLVAQALERYSKTNPTADLNEMLIRAKEIRQQVEHNYNTRHERAEIEKQKAIEDAKKPLKQMVNSLTESNYTAINNHQDLLNDKKKTADKINSDLQSLRWSLRESEDKEKLQNKITSLLSIIAILFAGLCIGFILYKVIGGVSKSSSTDTSNKGVLNSIFGFNKKTSPIKATSFGTSF